MRGRFCLCNSVSYDRSVGQKCPRSAFVGDIWHIADKKRRVCHHQLNITDVSYTPDYLVKRMLDFGNYRFGATQCRHVIDNSCGNGAFLTEIVRRYIVEFLERSNDLKLLQSELETFVHGVEIDRDEYAKCLHNLDKTAAEYGLSNVRWDIINSDALTLRQFDNKMEFVFGNPPYVRVHNLSDNYNSVKMRRCFECVFSYLL